MSEQISSCYVNNMSSFVFSEVQLKPHHPPYAVRRHWAVLLKWVLMVSRFLKKIQHFTAFRRFTTANSDQILMDETSLMMRRNVLLSLERERQVRLSEYVYRSSIAVIIVS